MAVDWVDFWLDAQMDTWMDGQVDPSINTCFISAQMDGQADGQMFYCVDGLVSSWNGWNKQADRRVAGWIGRWMYFQTTG